MRQPLDLDLPSWAREPECPAHGPEQRYHTRENDERETRRLDLLHRGRGPRARAGEIHLQDALGGAVLDVGEQAECSDEARMRAPRSTESTRSRGERRRVARLEVGGGGASPIR